MAIVNILNIEGKPLMPTKRCGHVRWLLKSGRAEVVHGEPFTIRLKYETPDVVQPLYLGIDPGRTNIGVSVVTENAESVFQAELVTRNKDVPKLMKERKTHRMAHRHYGRRCKRQRRAKAAKTTKGEFQRKLPGCEEPITCNGIRNKEARFNNRIRPYGWLTPTAAHLLLTHVNLVKKIGKYLPITDVVLESNSFSFMRMDDPTVKGVDFCNGKLHGFENVEDYVFRHQHGKCLLCDNKIEAYHHITPRRWNGSETVVNRCGLCRKHHELVHTDEAWAQKLEGATGSGAGKKYGALSVLNQILPSLTTKLMELFPGHVHLTTGYETSTAREVCGIEKAHNLDAFCIACAPLNAAPNGAPDLEIFSLWQYRRHDRQYTHKANVKRVYLEDGKPVAVNRHKAMEQKDDSLEEYRAAHTEAVVSRLTVKPHQPQYKDMRRAMPGSLLIEEGQTRPFVLHATKGRHYGAPDYYHAPDGSRHPARKCETIYKNTGILFV